MQCEFVSRDNEAEMLQLLMRHIDQRLAKFETSLQEGWKLLGDSGEDGDCLSLRPIINL